jgi:hypothetical protein
MSPDDDEKPTIETKILEGEYNSVDQLTDDIKRAKDAIDAQHDSARVNGHVKNNSMEGAASELLTLFSSHLDSTSDSKATTHASPSVSNHRNGQIITLRSQTEKGTQQLFSGLQVQRQGDKDVVVDGRRLPNGFDLTDPATMDSTLLAPPKEKRLFGDVFRPRPTVKQLEMPRSRPANRTSTLSFVTEPSLEKGVPINRADYKNQSLPTSIWLSYSKTTAYNDQDALRRQRERALTATDFRAALVANDVAANEADDANALFKKVFSSFTPIYDSSKGLINEQDHNRLYWQRYGKKRLNKIFRTDYPDIEEVNNKQDESEVFDDSFEDVVTNFQPAEDEDPILPQDEPANVDEVLDEISRLLETVHSYQNLRAASVRNPDPSGNELDTYELLRSQLKILVAALPPFALAKLDGNKLQDLNISTNIMVEGVDFHGTGQPDDYTLQRYRAAQQATTVAASRAPQQQTARQQYPTPATVQRFGTTNQSYQAPGVSAQAAYAQRPTANYQSTPSTQRQFPPANTYNPQAAVQQFQRPTPNGYGSYSTQTPQAQHPGYSQTPSQPGYQQRAQQQAALGYGRTASPTKPMMNGQTPFHNPAPYQRPTQQHQQSYSPAPQPTPSQSGVVNGA